MIGPAPDWVWPLAAEGLASSSVDEPSEPPAGPATAAGHPSAAIATDDWADRLDDAFAHGLAGLLASAWEHGRIDLAPQDLERLFGRLDDEATLAVRLEAEILRLTPVLERHSAVVIKGAALAHGAYPVASWRPFTDLDVLVEGGSVPAMLRDLERFGYRRPRPDPSPGFARRVAKATALVHPDGLVLDLHRTLAAGNPGHGIDVAEFLASRAVVSAGAVAVPVPGWTEHLVEVCLHAVLGGGATRAISVRDVAQVAAHPAVDCVGFIDLVGRWGVATACAAGLRAAGQLLDARLPDPLAEWAGVGSVEPPAGGYGVPVASAGGRLDEVMHGQLRRRSTLLRAMVAPTPTFLRWKYGVKPLPVLYCRRWRDLRHETLLARKVP